MPFNAIHEYDAAVAGNNTDIGGSNIAEGCAPSGINNALRELARQVRAAVANQGGDIASAATTNIGAASGQYVRVTGTTAIAAFGTVNAGVMRWVEFTGALTLTHNAASLRLPGAANIATAAGDVGLFVSLGAGNWKCLHYGRADGSAVAGFGGTLVSTDASAAEGPDFIADRASASPAGADIIGAFVMRGRDSAGGAADYAKLKGKILDATNGSEDGAGILSALVAGADTPVITFGPGVQIGAPAGGDKGEGTLNVATAIYLNGGTVQSRIQKVVVSTTAFDSTANNIPFDDTPPQNTEGKQLFSQTFSPLSPTSTIRIHGLMHVGVNSTADCKIAGFSSAAGAGAIFATEVTVSTSMMLPVPFFYEEAAVNTSARTYSLRYGPAAGETMQINGVGGGRKLGGTLESYMVIEEWR